ncbi:hypothetical protein PV326_007896 [Microctonus aethiopoides]|nr:hypothetical protein PV326_007896 [Microctonus aethiopoides]
MVDSRLHQLKNNEEVLGGINVLFSGNLPQLSLVRGNQVFDQLDRLIQHFVVLEKKLEKGGIGEFLIEKGFRIYPTNEQTNYFDRKGLTFF